MNQRLPSKPSKYDQELQAERLAREQQKLLFEMGSKWDQKKTIVMKKICPNNIKDKETIFKEHTFRFFKELYKIDLQCFFAPKPEILNYSDAIYEEESLIIYGVDFLAPAKIYNYFRYFHPTNISWINDSSVKLTFKYCNRARKAIFENLLPNCGRIYKIQKGLWYSLRPYYVLGFQRPLEARIATNYDLTVEEIQNSQYDVFQQANKKYLQEIEILTKRQQQVNRFLPNNLDHVGYHTFSKKAENNPPMNLPQAEINQKSHFQELAHLLQSQEHENGNQNENEDSLELFEANVTVIQKKKKNEVSLFGDFENEEESFIAYFKELNIKQSNPSFSLEQQLSQSMFK